MDGLPVHLKSIVPETIFPLIGYLRREENMATLNSEVGIPENSTSARLQP